jgi:hypothetical protein
MNSPADVSPAPAPLEAFHLFAAPRSPEIDEVMEPCPFLEINERRAASENVEMLRWVRSL